MLFNIFADYAAYGVHGVGEKGIRIRNWRVCVRENIFQPLCIYMYTWMYACHNRTFSRQKCLLNFEWNLAYIANPCEAEHIRSRLQWVLIIKAWHLPIRHKPIWSRSHPILIFFLASSWPSSCIGKPLSSWEKTHRWHWVVKH